MKSRRGNGRVLGSILRGIGPTLIPHRSFRQRADMFRFRNLLVTALLCLAMDSQAAAQPPHSFVFALEWIPGFCETKGGSCRLSPQPQKWNIHGLWPEGLQNCNSSDVLHRSDIEDLWGNLERDWVDAINPQDPLKFWAKEWKKHGTCWLNNENTRNAHDYFSTTLQLYEKFDVSTMLSRQGITPTEERSYTSAQFLEAFEGFRPFLHCPTKNDPFITEILICLDKQFNPRDCWAQPKSILACPQEGIRYLPKSKVT
ncbi:ribonuclease T2-like isoform X2 [Oscarella lobularis]|uniref:ribonuclease T2-like isoform X2 n=1 Tax=Oscarella lobularis TaxID=121494 RepID=UPI003314113F